MLKNLGLTPKPTAALKSRLPNFDMSGLSPANYCQSEDRACQKTACQTSRATDRGNLKER